MELDLEIKQQLAELLAKPSLVTQAHTAMLADLAQAYPYYQPLHLLLARASLGNADHQHYLATAALYNNGSLLHQIIYRPDSLCASDMAVVAPKEEIITDSVAAQPDEQEVFEEIAEITLTPSETEEQTTLPGDEEETFDEIAEVNTTEFAPAEEVTVPTASEKPIEAIADEMAIESIVATDFFAFEKSFKTETNVAETTPSIPQPEEYDQEAEEQTVSKYNDDKLPYTFLWWLAKTRKEHEQIFQPYVSHKKAPQTTATNELQHQYVEHIFHIQTPFNADEATASGTVERPHTKGDEIIESFIKNEPQIRPPKPEQINNENKAKKSAEDNYDLVSETLASIYIEQMLYHKAIDTYEKLSLKFPEKSRYFADLIQSLEKKI